MLIECIYPILRFGDYTVQYFGAESLVDYTFKIAYMLDKGRSDTNLHLVLAYTKNIPEDILFKVGINQLSPHHNIYTRYACSYLKKLCQDANDMENTVCKLVKCEFDYASLRKMLVLVMNSIAKTNKKYAEEMLHKVMGCARSTTDIVSQQLCLYIVVALASTRIDDLLPNIYNEFDVFKSIIENKLCKEKSIQVNINLLLCVVEDMNMNSIYKCMMIEMLCPALYQLYYANIGEEITEKVNTIMVYYYNHNENADQRLIDAIEEPLKQYTD